VRREERARSGQSEDAVADRTEQGPRVALLEVCAPAAANQQRVAGEGHAIGHERHAAARVTGGRARFEAMRADCDPIAVAEQEVGIVYAAAAAHRDPRAERLAEPPRGRHVVGVHVRLEGEDEFEV
jgi:hypothetical protein